MSEEAIIQYARQKAAQLGWPDWGFEFYQRNYISCVINPNNDQLYSRTVSMLNMKLIPYRIEFKLNAPPSEILIVGDGNTKTFPVDPTPGQSYVLDIPLHVYNGRFSVQENPYIAGNAYMVYYLAFFEQKPEPRTFVRQRVAHAMKTYTHAKGYR